MLIGRWPFSVFLMEMSSEQQSLEKEIRNWRKKREGDKKGMDYVEVQ